MHKTPFHQIIYWNILLESRFINVTDNFMKVYEDIPVHFVITFVKHKQQLLSLGNWQSDICVA